MNKEELRIIKQLDNGSLYADPLIIEELFRYPDMRQPHLLVSHDNKGKPSAYLPVGYYYGENNGRRPLTYIAAMPNSPAISATYPPRAEQILCKMSQPYFDSDIVADFACSNQQATASIICLSLD